MEKEDILLKSKNDNRKGDELQVQNKQNAEMFGYGSVMFVLVILMIMGSELVSGEIDREIKKIIDGCYAKAKELILQNEAVLHESAKLLLEKEKIGRDEFEALFGA